MNKIALTGRLAADPQFKFFDSGTALCNFAIAVNGGREGETYFFDCESWKATAESIQNARKGDEISILGQLKQQRWNDKETGKERSKVVVLAWNVGWFSKPPEAKPRNPQTKIDAAEYGVPF